jgi:nitrate/nitrite transporter NarK
LSPAQVQRLNRLTLEAAYPDHVKKLYVAGWRPVMWVYGAAGVAVAALFWLVFRNRPEQHPLANAAEVALIESSRPPTVSSPHGRAGAVPLGAILRQRSLWLSSLSQFMTNFGWIFLNTWLPRYLAEVHRVPVIERGWMAGLPMGVGMVGMLAGGWVTDRLTRALGLRWGRGLPMSLTRFVAMAAFASCVFAPSPWWAVAALAVMAVSVDLGTGSVWAYMQDVGGRHVGSVLGWGNMWGAVGAAVSPLVLGWAIDRPGLGWNAAFLTCAAAFLVSGLAALGVDARVPVVPEVSGR